MTVRNSTDYVNLYNVHVDAKVRMEASTKNVEAIGRLYKQVVEQHYKEPVTGQFVDLYIRSAIWSGDGKQ